MLSKIASLISEHFTSLKVIFFFSLAAFVIFRSHFRQRRAKRIFQKRVEMQKEEPSTLHPRIDAAKCLGCGACTKVCPEGDILQMVSHKAVLVAPSKCIGHGVCEAVCPYGAIDLVFGTRTRGVDIPRLTSNYETNISGLYIAGELGGMGLISNAIKQGQLAARSALKNLDSSLPTQTDLFIIGAGPAGMAACLTAIEQKVSYVCIEQGSFGGAVTNYPRQKLVMTHPVEMPLAGRMRFPKNRVLKEELLEYWRDIQKRFQVQVQEGERFLTLKKENGTFHITTSQQTYTAKSILLALGVRGSPRRLELPNEDLPKVTYNLIEPEQYQDSHVTVVGAGNSAVEAAVALAQPHLKNTVTLLVRGTSLNRCHEDNRLQIEELAQKNLVQIHFNSSVEAISAKSIDVRQNDRRFRLKNQFLFILIGADLPFQFLMDLGIGVDKKFGEPLSKATDVSA